MKKLIFALLALVLGTAGAQVPAPVVIDGAATSGPPGISGDLIAFPAARQDGVHTIGGRLCSRVS